MRVTPVFGPKARTNIRETRPRTRLGDFFGRAEVKSAEVKDVIMIDMADEDTIEPIETTIGPIETTIEPKEVVTTEVASGARSKSAEPATEVQATNAIQPVQVISVPAKSKLTVERERFVAGESPDDRESCQKLSARCDSGCCRLRLRAVPLLPTVASS